MIKLTIVGKPFGKQAAVTTRFGGFNKGKGKVVGTENYYARVQSIFAGEYPGFVPLSGALDVLIMAYYPIPIATSKKKRLMMLTREIRPTIKPDCNNISKVFDALNQIAFIDDKQIVTEHIEKLYSDRPRVEITIKEI